jgi:hypothetical protein
MGTSENNRDKMCSLISITSYITEIPQLFIKEPLIKSKIIVIARSVATKQSPTICLFLGDCRARLWLPAPLYRLLPCRYALAMTRIF